MRPSLIVPVPEPVVDALVVIVTADDAPAERVTLVPPVAAKRTAVTSAGNVGESCNATEVADLLVTVNVDENVLEDGTAPRSTESPSAPPVATLVLVPGWVSVPGTTVMKVPSVAAPIVEPATETGEALKVEKVI